MTYNSLRDQIISYLNRSDLATLNQIPNFISQAEQRIARESKNIGLEVYIEDNFTTGDPFLQKPELWRRNLSLICKTGENFQDSKQLYLRSYEFIKQYWPNEDERGEPLYYADYGYRQLIVCPTPVLDYPYQYCYLALPQPLSTTNQKNWLTDYAPDVILYASLLEAMGFLKNDERIEVWKGYYSAALQSLNTQDDMRLLDRASNRMAD
ncbi:MAG TPA: hypothetical protein VHA52_09950 [Candidatus Babeliaceae bacterium]|nr:hypothetical protein [Candidatus Babeliaceae bacterium]